MAVKKKQVTNVDQNRPVEITTTSYNEGTDDATFVIQFGASYTMAVDEAGLKQLKGLLAETLLSTEMRRCVIESQER